MIRDEEQKARELKQEIALMQSEGQHDLQHEPPLLQRTPAGDLFIPQRRPFIPHAAAFQGINYLDERSPLAPQLQVSPWPTNFRAGTYPKYNGNTDPAQYIMSYQVAVASSGGDDATMAKSFIIALEGPGLTSAPRRRGRSLSRLSPPRAATMARVAGATDGRSNRADITACFMAKTARTQRGIARKRRPPGTGCLGHNPPTTKMSCRAHISTPPPTTIQPWPRPASTQPRISAPPGGTSLTTPTPASASTKSTPPKSPQAPKQEDFADQPYRGVIHMITGGSSVDFETKRQNRDHYRSVNHVVLTGPVV
jgi:hypothetical protein